MDIQKLIRDLSRSGVPVTVNIYVGDHYHCEPGGYIAVRGDTIHGDGQAAYSYTLKE